MSTYQEILAKNKLGSLGKYQVVAIKNSEVGYDESLVHQKAQDEPNEELGTRSCTFTECGKPIYPYRQWDSLIPSRAYKMGMCEKCYKGWKKNNG